MYRILRNTWCRGCTKDARDYVSRFAHLTAWPSWTVWPVGALSFYAVRRDGARFWQLTKESAVVKNGLEALLRPQDSFLALVDHQPFQFANMNSHEPTMIMNNVVGLAKAGKLFGVPTLLSTVLKDRGGRLLQSVQEVFPEQTPLDRTLINSWQDERFVEAVRNSGRKQLVLAALWTEICLAMTAVQALGEGYDVFIVTDASGGASVEAHEMAVRRMVAAGAVPITWLAVASEWQRDWAREDTVDGFSNILMEHGGASSVALGWEQQLLTSGRTTSS